MTSNDEPVFLGLDADRAEVAEALFELLTYPEGPLGETVIAHSFRAAIAYHLARCDVKIGDNPSVRKRDVDGRGVFEDACVWVPVGMSDEEYDAATARRARALREKRAAEAKSSNWTVRNKITIKDEGS